MEVDYDTMDLTVYGGDIDLFDGVEPQREDKSSLIDRAWE